MTAAELLFWQVNVKKKGPVLDTDAQIQQRHQFKIVKFSECFRDTLGTSFLSSSFRDSFSFFLVFRSGCSLVERPQQSVLQRESARLRVPGDALLHRRPRVVSLQVLDHLELLLGPVGAVSAAEGLLLGVGHVVVPESRRPSEGPLAEAAAVRATAAVLMLMGLEHERRLEGLAALLADVRARVAVPRVSVTSQGIGSVCAEVTLVAGVRFVSFRGEIRCVSHVPSMTLNC